MWMQVPITEKKMQHLLRNTFVFFFCKVKAHSAGGRSPGRDFPIISQNPLRLVTSSTDVADREIDLVDLVHSASLAFSGSSSIWWSGIRLARRDVAPCRAPRRETSTKVVLFLIMKSRGSFFKKAKAPRSQLVHYHVTTHRPPNLKTVSSTCCRSSCPSFFCRRNGSISVFHDLFPLAAFRETIRFPVGSLSFLQEVQQHLKEGHIEFNPTKYFAIQSPPQRSSISTEAIVLNERFRSWEKNEAETYKSARKNGEPSEVWT